MHTSIPFQNLHRINLLMTLFVNLFVLIILAIADVQTWTFVATNFVRGCIVIYLHGLCNIFTLHLWQTKYARSLKRGVALRYLFSTLLSLSVYTLLLLAFTYLLGNAKELADQKLMLTHFIAFIIFNTLIILLHNQVLLQHSKAQAEIENMQLKAAVSEASNLLLRQQIHPHFLFNSLTILKSLYKKDAAKGEFYVTTLANFLRASISNHTAKITSLESELALCMDYMDMQKIRFGSAIHYSVDLSEEVKGYFVPSFSIQVLLENAIKHNAMTQVLPLKIRVSENNGYIKVSNNVQAKKNKELSTGQGLANLAERYQLLSGDKVVIDQSEECFSVSIKLYKDENCNY